jgi:adenylate cyclase
VNLGARLEPLNNDYGTRVCLSQATLDAAGGRDRFLVRYLDLVAVKGKKEPVPVYELIGRADDRPLAERYAPVLEPYHRGMLLYRALRFEEAGALFRAALGAANGLDQPSAVYVERCQALAQSPPGPGWDGAHAMRHK